MQSRFLRSSLSRTILTRIETGRLVLLSSLLGLLVGVLCIVLRFGLEQLAPLRGWLTGYTPPGIPGEGGLLMAFGEVTWWSLAVLPVAGGLYTWLIPALPGSAFSQLVRGYHARAQGLTQGLHFLEQCRTLLGLLVGYFSGLMVGRDSIYVMVGQMGSSLLERLTTLDATERRTLMLAGASAALGSVLHAPMAAAVLIAEVLYRRFEFEFEVLMSCVLASIVAYATYGLMYGFEPLISVSLPGIPAPTQVALYVVVTFMVTVVAWALLLACRVLPSVWSDGPHRPFWGAALGLLTALLVWLSGPQILSDGMGWFQVGLSGFLTLESTENGIWRWVLLALGARLALGGGVMPSVAAGGLLGIGLGQWLELDPAMAGLLGAVSFLTVTLNVPVGAALLAIAWAGDIVLPAALLAAGMAHLVSGESGIVPGQLSSRSSRKIHRSSEAFRIGPRRVIEADKDATDGVVDANNTVRTTAGKQVEAQTETVKTSEHSGASHEKVLLRRPIPASWQGVALKLLILPDEIEIVGLIRDGEVRIPRNSDVRLLEGDELFLLAFPEAYKALDVLWNLPNNSADQS